MIKSFVIDSKLINFAELKSNLDARVLVAKNNKQELSVSITESYIQNKLDKITHTYTFSE